MSSFFVSHRLSPHIQFRRCLGRRQGQPHRLAMFQACCQPTTTRVNLGSEAGHGNPDPLDTHRHLGGTYTQSGTSVSGTGSNPGVGDLDIEGTLSADGKTMELDSIEHWHDPFKHNVATLTRQ